MATDVPIAEYWEAPLQFVAAACLGMPFNETAPLDWAQVCALAQSHKVEGLVWRRVVEDGAPVPSEWRQWLEREHGLHALDYLGKLAETLKIVGELERHGHPVIVLKGCAVAEQFYAPAPQLKQSGDIDVLVAPEDFAAADALLQRNGYAREMPGLSLPPRAMSMACHLVNSFEYFPAEGGPRVELHHRLLTDPYTLAVPFSELLDRSTEFVIADRKIRGLGGTDLMPFLCSHGAGHMYVRLKWLADVVRVLRAIDQSVLDAAIDRARENGCERAFAVTLAVLDRIGVKEAREAARGLPDVRPALVDAVLRAIATGSRECPPGLRDMPEQLRALRFQLGLAETARSKRFMALKHLMNLEDVIALGLGRPWQPVYAILGRPLALSRYARRLLSSG